MDTRQALLDATERIIQAKGIARVTTKEIAREAGYAEGTLYKHFEHKEDLFLSVLQRHLPHFVEVLDERLVGQGALRANLELIATAAIDYYDKLIPLATAFFADTDLLGRHREVIEPIDGGPQRICDRIAHYIAQEQDLGRIAAEQDAQSIAALLIGPCFQHIFNRYFMGKNTLAVTDQQFVTSIVQTLIVGITPRTDC